MKKIIGVLLSLYAFFFSPFFVQAISLRLPGSTYIMDVKVGVGGAVQGKASSVMSYIQLANKYLWIAMVVVAFAVIIRIGFKLISNPAGSKDGIETLKKGIIAFGIGLAVILFSYTIVRLVINLL